MSSQGFETSYQPTPKMIFLFSPSTQACPLLNILSLLELSPPSGQIVTTIFIWFSYNFSLYYIENGLN